jgi:glycosyltransferase involved in cell wall biosynthesis
MEEFKVSDPLKRIAYAPFRAWMRAAARQADRVIATDEAMRQEVSHFLGVEAGKVAVIPNGVDVEHARSMVVEQERSRLAARWPALATDVKLKGLSVGRLEENKGFEYLLRALSRLQASRDSWNWVIVGEGSLRSHLEQVAAGQGLADNVVFAGALTDTELHTLYDMSDLFAHPTLYEGSSLVTLEAMAHGLPVVASAVGGIPDKVTEGVTGFLVGPGDVEGLAGRVGWMLEHPVERQEMGTQGARVAETRFDWESIADSTEELFSQLAAEKAACRAAEAAARSC